MNSIRDNKYFNNENNMNINNILNDSHSKIFFLKAILLGINYGQDKHSELYKKTIENELFNLTNITEKNKEINKEQNKEINKEYTNKLIHLNNEKKYIMSYILKLSKNYGFNYSRINILKNSLLLLNKDIEKTVKLLENYNNKENQYKENISITDVKLNNELEETLENLSNLMI